jgi:hypothetical protein
MIIDKIQKINIQIDLFSLLEKVLEFVNWNLYRFMLLKLNMIMKF